MEPSDPLSAAKPVESCGEITTCPNCGDSGMFYERYLGEWVPCRVCRPEDWEAHRV